MTHVLFTSVLFNLQVFGDFPAFCLLLISSLTPLLSESWCCMISISFKFVKVCFMSQDVVYLDKCPMGAWEKCIFCCCWMNLLINVSYMRLTEGTVDFNYVLTDFLPAGSIFDRQVLESPLYHWILLFLLIVLFLLHVFWCSVIRHIPIKNCYIFLKSWCFYHCVMLVFIPDNFPCSEVQNQYSCHCFLLISVSMVYLSPSIYF